MKQMEDFINSYFISPILDKTGYNPVNTIIYALIALFCLYIIRHLFRKYNVQINKDFIFSVIPFVLLGSTVRVVTDSIDSGIFKPITPIHKFILDSHIYDYNYLTVSPGIYLVIAAIFLSSLIILRKMKMQKLLPKMGLFLWLIHFLLLIPFFKFFWIALPILALAFLPFIIVYKFYNEKVYSLMGLAHGLDGAATFITLDYAGSWLGLKYFEQHYFSNGLCNLFGTCATFYLVKSILPICAAYLLTKEKADDLKIQSDVGNHQQSPLDFDKNFFVLVIIIMGFAPGLRDVLRLVIGT